jgi:DNA-binding transcriptional ArsR family regulator
MRLAGSDATVTELAEPYNVSLQAVSKHLKVLGKAGLVSRSRDAQRRPVHLAGGVVFDKASKWLERYRIQAEKRYHRLESVLADRADQNDPPVKGQGK